AYANGVGWVIFVSHIWDSSWYSDDYVRQIIDYALSKGFEFVTTQEGIDRMGNMAQFGESKITSEGKFVGGLTIERTNLKDNPVLSNTPINHFEKNTITHTRILSPQSEGFPGNTSGVLITYRYSDDIYSYQEFVTSREKFY